MRPLPTAVCTAVVTAVVLIVGGPASAGRQPVAEPVAAAASTPGQVDDVGAGFRPDNTIWG